jgi:broad specificity phosphatase PhoE
MKTIYFMRHTQSEANLKDILASRQDFPLTEKGRQEAVAIASEFKDIAQLDRIFCSPLIRAQQTAQPIAEAFGLDVETDERITEQDLGVFSGMTYAELDDRSNYMHERSKRWKWIPEGGGESYEMIANRLEPFFQSLVRAKSPRTAKSGKCNLQALGISTMWNQFFLAAARPPPPAHWAIRNTQYEPRVKQWLIIF